ncbi:response regulator [Desulfosporosinus metallidurans]|uniref:Stage 0 sporulation protein A homolog n=1 Tax=Desulfosporosinus metallidurans TaxID=1888891 RepID=A0A1Q8QZY7_9FIRM|nr:response regulator transcription factor [Desulfosporosinus metallidurans]OLN32932.1 two-component response regulator [Desulfosporosinus metallidurans]
MSDKKLRILLGDDHAVLRAGLRVLLNLEEDIEVVGEAADGEEVVEMVEKILPDLVLLDLTMPKLSGLECIERILEKHPTTKILVLTMHDDEEYMKAVIRAGGKGYVLKKAADVELLSAIRMVSRGELYVYPPMAAAMLYQMVGPQTPGIKEKKEKGLSEREREVLKYLALGHTNHDIAELLHISVKTVETYKTRVMEKLDLRKRAELVRYAMENGIING